MAGRSTSAGRRTGRSTRDELATLLEQVGITSVEWLMPEQSGFFQPLVTGIKT